MDHHWLTGALSQLDSLRSHHPPANEFSKGLYINILVGMILKEAQCSLGIIRLSNPRLLVRQSESVSMGLPRVEFSQF